MKPITSTFRIHHIKRYRTELFAGYGIAAFITFSAVIIHSLPYDTVARCDSFRPRFGESQCFFSGILLTITTILYITTIKFLNWYPNFITVYILNARSTEQSILVLFANWIDDHRQHNCIFDDSIHSL